MSANVPARLIGPVPESVPQSSWAPWLTQIARARNLDAATIATAGISNFAGFVTSTPLNLYVSKAGADTKGKGFDSTTPCLTLAYALTLARDWNVGRGNIVINFGSGTWAESVAIAGPLWGSWADASFNPGQIVLNGNGAANTTLSGAAGQTFTVCASYGGAIGVQNMTIAAAGTGQSALFAQIGGLINAYGGLIFSGANAQIAHAENSGAQIQFWNDFTVSGSAQYLALAGSNSLVEFNPVGATRTITLTGTPAFSSGTLGAAYNGTVYFGQGWQFSGAATGPQHFADMNGVVYNATASAALAGNAIGNSGRGGWYYPPTVPTVNATTGLGTGGSASFDSGSGSQGGAIVLTTGTAATAATGNVQITFNNDLAGFNNSQVLPVVAMPANAASGWSQGATVICGGLGTNTLTFVWANNGFALALNTSYRICYICGPFG